MLNLVLSGLFAASLLTFTFFQTKITFGWNFPSFLSLPTFFTLFISYIKMYILWMVALFHQTKDYWGDIKRVLLQKCKTFIPELPELCLLKTQQLIMFKSFKFYHPDNKELYSINSRANRRWREPFYRNIFCVLSSSRAQVLYIQYISTGTNG